MTQLLAFPLPALIMAIHRFFQPGCMFRVRVKTGDSNPHIERASPSFIDIQVKHLLMNYNFRYAYELLIKREIKILEYMLSFVTVYGAVRSGYKK